MIKIYHNPRCRKSREGLEFLKNSGKEFEIIEYLKNPVSEKTLKDILKKLQIAPIDLVRKNEAVWKSSFKKRDLSDDEIIKAMLEHPKLIERPVVTNNYKAVIARPAHLISQII